MISPHPELRMNDYLFQLTGGMYRYFFYSRKTFKPLENSVPITDSFEARYLINRLLEDDRQETLYRLRQLVCYADFLPDTRLLSDDMIRTRAEELLPRFMILREDKYARKLSPSIKAMIEQKEAEKEAERAAVVPGEVVEEEKFLELYRKDEDGNPVGNVPYVVTFVDGKVVSGSLDENGYAKIKGDPAGAQIEYPGTEMNDWD